MDIPQPRFEIGQKVWVVRETVEQKYSDCVGCKGQKKLTFSEHKLSVTVECPLCHGNGHPWEDPTHTRKVRKLAIEDAVVTGISILLGTARWNPLRNDSVEYRLAKTLENWNVFNESALYPSAEAAQAVCGEGTWEPFVREVRG